MNQQIIIPIHSFVDVITNSSTEIYVSADNNTVQTLKNIVDKILEIGGSTKRCDDIMTIHLDEDGDAVIVPKDNDPQTALILNYLANPRALFNIDAEYNG